MTTLRLLAATLFLGGLCAPAGHSAAFHLQEPTADRWNYPFNGTPGTRPAASVFGAVGEAGFDDRDGQMLVRFQTTGILPAGLGAASYAITALQLSMTINVGNSFVYDPSYDSYRSHLGTSSPNFLADADAGRPIELFAVGYRNGATSATYGENSAFSTGNAMTESSRTAYAAGVGTNGALFDVSNNVANGFEVSPLAIGAIQGVNAGSLVPEDAVVNFTFNLTDPGVLAWLQASMNAGYLEFMVTSLHSTSQGAGSGFPSFYTKENILHDPAGGDLLAGQLLGEVTAVPEPGTLGLVLAGGIVLAVAYGRRRRE